MPMCRNSRARNVLSQAAKCTFGVTVDLLARVSEDRTGCAVAAQHTAIWLIRFGQGDVAIRIGDLPHRADA